MATGIMALTNILILISVIPVIVLGFEGMKKTLTEPKIQYQPPNSTLNSRLSNCIHSLPFTLF